MATKTQTTETTPSNASSVKQKHQSPDRKEVITRVAWTIGLAFLSGVGTAAGSYTFNRISGKNSNNPEGLEGTNVLSFKEAL